MNNVIKVRVKEQYGIERVFPADPTATLFARLIGQKTLTPRDLALIEQLGYRIEQVTDPIKVWRNL